MDNGHTLLVIVLESGLYIHTLLVIVLELGSYITRKPTETYWLHHVKKRRNNPILSFLEPPISPAGCTFR